MDTTTDRRRRILHALALALLVIASGCAPSQQGRRSSSQSRGKPPTSAPTFSSIDGSDEATAQPESDGSEDPADAYTRLLPKARAVERSLPERREILDVLRPLVEKHVHQSVVFDVYTIRSTPQFAGVVARAVRPNGDRVDYSDTEYQQMIDQGAFDEHLIALFKRVDGRWRVLEFELGATDYVGGAWLYKYRVPADVFGY